MVKRTGPQTLELQNLIRDLKILGDRENISLWKRIARELERPTRIRRKVNLYKIEKNVRDGETALVPGKVLSLGNLSRKLTIAAYSFSDNALEKIKEAGAKAISINQLIKENPKGKKVRIMG